VVFSEESDDDSGFDLKDEMIPDNQIMVFSDSEASDDEEKESYNSYGSPLR
jgi:hypothetical protein